MPTLTCSRDPDAPQETWHIHYGDVQVGMIGRRAGVPAEADQWGWVRPGECAERWRSNCQSRLTTRAKNSRPYAGAALGPASAGLFGTGDYTASTIAESIRQLNLSLDTSDDPLNCIFDVIHLGTGDRPRRSWDAGLQIAFVNDFVSTIHDLSKLPP